MDGEEPRLDVDALIRRGIGGDDLALRQAAIEQHGLRAGQRTQALGIGARRAVDPEYRPTLRLATGGRR